MTTQKPVATKQSSEPQWRTVEGALRYLHRFEHQPIWQTSQVLARLSGEVSPGGSDSGLSELDHHAQAAYLVRLLRRRVDPWAWHMIRCYYVPDTEVGRAEKEEACARVADQLLEYLDDPSLHQDWVRDLVRGWAGLPMWKAQVQWARELSQDRKTLRRHRYGSTEIEGVEEVLEEWRGQSKGQAGGPLRECGLVGEPTAYVRLR